jgi:hypothetical protein
LAVRGVVALVQPEIFAALSNRALLSRMLVVSIVGRHLPVTRAKRRQTLRRRNRASAFVAGRCRASCGRKILLFLLRTLAGQRSSQRGKSPAKVRSFCAKIFAIAEHTRAPLPACFPDGGAKP